MHRDLKPANIMITNRGQVKVLDFGLAKVLQRSCNREPANSIHKPELNRVMGTLKANEYFRAPSYDERNIRTAIELYLRSIQLDPNFAQASARLARMHFFLFHEGYEPTEERLLLGKQAADNAIRLAPDSPDALIAVGYYYYHGLSDYEKGLEYFNKAAAVAPNNVEAIGSIAFIERRQGKFEDSLDRLFQLFELDPRGIDIPLEASSVLIRLRRYAEAQKLLDRCLQLAPNQVYGYGIKQKNIILWKGDLEEARRVLEKMPDNEPAFSNAFWLDQEFLERNYSAALARLNRIPVEVYQEESRFTRRVLMQADAHWLMKQESSARENYEKARIFLEEKIRERPQDPAVHTSLSRAYAGLGRKEDAIREAKVAIELLPVSRDAFQGPGCLANLSEIYCRVGEYDKALDEIDHLLSIPSWFSVEYLKLSPLYDSLRNHPRYKQILEKHSKS